MTQRTYPGSRNGCTEKPSREQVYPPIKLNQCIRSRGGSSEYQWVPNQCGKVLMHTQYLDSQCDVAWEETQYRNLVCLFEEGREVFYSYEFSNFSCPQTSNVLPVALILLGVLALVILAIGAWWYKKKKMQGREPLYKPVTVLSSAKIEPPLALSEKSVLPCSSFAPVNKQEYTPL